MSNKTTTFGNTSIDANCREVHGVPHARAVKMAAMLNRRAYRATIQRVPNGNFIVRAERLA